MDDFAFGLWALVMLLPLVSIYVSLRCLKWEPRARLFLDSWIIFLAWFVSLILVYAALAITVDSFKLYWISNFWWLILAISTTFVGGFLVMTAVVSLLNRRVNNSATMNLFEGRERPQNLQKPVYVALMTSIACVVSLTVLLGVIAAVGVVIEYFDPQPNEVEFGIYDI